VGQSSTFDHFASLSIMRDSLNNRVGERSELAKLELVQSLRQAVGKRHVVTKRAAVRRYATGYRSGAGDCLAVIRPGTLLEMWRALQLCVAANVAIIPQAANTGLTGGSTPDTGYDRDVVVLNTLRLGGIRSLRGGDQVVCLAGATLSRLEQFLRPLRREPHSVIGSSCIGASVIGGVCNNSGGALVRRGPAYTELALYAQLDEHGQLKLVNHLGIELGDAPEEILERLENPRFQLDPRITTSERRASDDEYERHVRDVHAATPARFNADPRRLHEASGCAGKLVVFAVRLDTFPAETETVTFYLGTNDPAALTSLRRAILTNSPSLPVAAEYMHRDAFVLAERYGKDTFFAIRILGADRLPMLYRAKSAIDGLAARLPFAVNNVSDRLLQAAGRILPAHLPGRLRRMRDQYEHHLLLKVAADSIAYARNLLSATWAAAGDFIECSPDESSKAFLHRFVTAGAAIRYRAIHGNTIEDIVALDVALPRNESEWVETLPQDLEQQVVAKLYYGHFFCHVFHQDYLVRKGADPLAFEHAMWAQLDARRAEYPAEHNVGHLYRAKLSLERHYRALDPVNVFNPGVGQLSKLKHWGSAYPELKEQT
jgi:D-lactate dehydrogenase